jgi:hypothetical protein
MKRLITTTAIAALLAAPVAAQTSTQTETQPGQTQASPSGQMELQASNLIGKRLYIQRDPAGQTGAMESGTQEGQQLDVEVRPSDEGEAETAEEQPLQEQDQQTEQAQQTEGQPQGTQQGTTDMARLEQGLAEVPEDWAMAGEIDDVLLSQEGEVQALVIDTGGFLGMNEATRRIDIQDVRFVPDTDDPDEFFAVYTGGRQTFESAEGFDEASLGEGTVRGTEMWRDEIAGSQADIAFTSITTDELVGTAVYGSEDNWVGEIGELALTEDGQIQAVIVDVGGFLGIGEKPVALSMEQIQLRRGEGGIFGDDLRAYVNATEEELESMEAWEEDAG